MADWELSALAEMIAREQGLGTLIPVIEKELIHYDIFDALDELGLLNSLTFQGGTCLRLCYGAQRYSEDLDFCAGEAFGDIDFASLAVKLDKRLGAKFGANVRVRGPGKANDFGNVSVKRWVVVVDTAPARPDLPSQKVTIEVASVAARTVETRLLRLNYDVLPFSYANIIVRCQTLLEILADKAISFANTRGFVRNRDAWDIPWCLGRLPELEEGQLRELVAVKHGDYACEDVLDDLLALGEERIGQTIRSDRFALEMQRFLPAATASRTVGREEWREMAARTGSELYRRLRAAAHEGGCGTARPASATACDDPGKEARP